MRYYRDLPVAFGLLRIVEEDGAIVQILVLRQPERAPEGYARGETLLLSEAARQLEEYFAGARREFDLPLAPKGTPFQQSVWALLRQIPYGETRSYGQLAAALGNPKASRAVGGANHNNPIAIVVPCHRVIGADGSLTGYAGGLDIKAYLLRLEGVLRD